MPARCHDRRVLPDENLEHDRRSKRLVNIGLALLALGTLLLTVAAIAYAQR